MANSQRYTREIPHRYRLEAQKFNSGYVSLPTRYIDPFTGERKSESIKLKGTGTILSYTIIHIPREQVVQALSEMKRVLTSEGLLLLSFHLGAETLHLDEWYEKPVSLDFIFFQRLEMEHYLESAGFEIVNVTERSPYPDVEYQSQRVYILARKPGQDEA